MSGEKLKELEEALKKIAPPPAPADKPDEKAQGEHNKYEYRRQETQDEIRRDNLEKRKEFAKKIYDLVGFWLLIVFFLLFLSGIEEIKFSLADGVLIALISGGTLNVIGLLAIVAKYYFYREK